VVADQVLVIRGDHHFPLRRLRWLEALGGIMELSDKGTEPAQFARCERQKSVGRLPGTYSRTWRPSSSRPSERGAPEKPTSAKWSSSASTAAVLAVAGLRTVEPTRTTASATFPPSRTCSTDEFMGTIVPVAPADRKTVTVTERRPTGIALPVVAQRSRSISGTATGHHR
jgi:hypothetical protein